MATSSVTARAAKSAPFTYTETSATTGAAMGTSVLVKAMTVTVYDPEGYLLKARNAVTSAPGDRVIELERTSTVFPAWFFTTP